MDGLGLGGGEKALKPQLESLQGSIFGTHSTPDLSFPDPSTLSSQLHTKGPCVGVPVEAMHLYCLPSPEPWHAQSSTRCGRQEGRGWAPDRSQRAEGSSSPSLPPCLLAKPPLSTLLPAPTPLSLFCFHGPSNSSPSSQSLPPLPLCPSLAGLQSQWNLETEPDLILANIQNKTYHSNKFPWRLDTRQMRSRERLLASELYALSLIPRLTPSTIYP